LFRIMVVCGLRNVSEKLCMNSIHKNAKDFQKS